MKRLHFANFDGSPGYGLQLRRYWHGESWQGWGHTGSVPGFNSATWVFPGLGVGFFVSVNCGGRARLLADLRSDFLDTFFPTGVPPRPLAWSGASDARAQALAGAYLDASYPRTTVMATAMYDGRVEVVACADGTGDILVDGVRYLEVAPLSFQAVGSWRPGVAFRASEGGLVGSASDAGAEAAIRGVTFLLVDMEVYQPEAWYQSRALSLALLWAALVVCTAWLVAYPVAVAAARRANSRPTGGNRPKEGDPAGNHVVDLAWGDDAGGGPSADVALVDARGGGTGGYGSAVVGESLHGPWRKRMALPCWIDRAELCAVVRLRVRDGRDGRDGGGRGGGLGSSVTLPCCEAIHAHIAMITNFSATQQAAATAGTAFFFVFLIVLFAWWLPYVDNFDGSFLPLTGQYFNCFLFFFTFDLFNVR